MRSLDHIKNGRGVISNWSDLFAPVSGREHGIEKRVIRKGDIHPLEIELADIENNNHKVKVRRKKRKR